MFMGPVEGVQKPGPRSPKRRKITPRSACFGELVEFSAASQAQAAIDDLDTLACTSALRNRVMSFRSSLKVLKFVTQALFMAIFAALIFALYR
jgi:hypothetical protein